jgi:hypothetical protein
MESTQLPPCVCLGKSCFLSFSLEKAEDCESNWTVFCNVPSLNQADTAYIHHTILTWCRTSTAASAWLPREKPLVISPNLPEPNTTGVNLQPLQVSTREHNTAQFMDRLHPHPQQQNWRPWTENIIDHCLANVGQNVEQTSESGGMADLWAFLMRLWKGHNTELPHLVGGQADQAEPKRLEKDSAAT